MDGEAEVFVETQMVECDPQPGPSMPSSPSPSEETPKQETAPRENYAADGDRGEACLQV